MPLLGRHRSHGSGLAEDGEAGAGRGGGEALHPSGPSSSTLDDRPRSRQSTRGTSILDLTGDHFAFGDIHGLGRGQSVGGLLHHDFVNRGKGVYEEERERLRLPALVESGRHAGRSRVEYRGAGIAWHKLSRDFFITMLETPFLLTASWMAALYMFVFFFWGTAWYLVVRYYSGCLYGATTFVESWTFAIVTQMTIGYGNTGPQRCWVAAWMICVQTILNLLLNAVLLGIIFAKVANPRYRAYSIYISDSACVSRRDGILKLLFRVADVRRTQVIEPKVKAFLYTWGEGRVTKEGEQIPVRCEPLDLTYIDGMLLLPLIIEHTIDERSPLCGHTYDSLAAMNAEIVITFEATTEMGNPFYARQSYLAQEINWGGLYQEIIEKPAAGEEDPRYKVNLDSFHDVRCPLIEDASDDEEARSQASQARRRMLCHVVHRAKRGVPYPLLGENTLVLSDVLCVRPLAGPGNRMELACRVADTYPHQMLDITARIYLYRWRSLEWCQANPTLPSFTLHSLECGYKKGTDKLYLRLPQEVRHTIDAGSPLASWLEPGGLSEDADSEIVVVLQAYLYQTGTNRMRQRTYRVGSHVRYGFTFAPAVKPPYDTRDGKPRVQWSKFFDVEPVGWAEGGRGRPTIHLHRSALQNPAVQAYMERRTMLSAPESHAPARAQQERNRLIDRALDTPRSKSARWVPPGSPRGMAAWSQQPFGPAPRESPQPGVAAAAAGEEPVPAGAVLGLQPAGPAQLPAQLAAAAEEVGEEDSSGTPSSPMERYQLALGRASLEERPSTGGSMAPAERAEQQAGGGGAAAAAAAVAVAAPAGPSALSGPPDLTMLSAEPSVPLDRYAAAPTCPSMDLTPGRSGEGGGAWRGGAPPPAHMAPPPPTPPTPEGLRQQQQGEQQEQQRQPAWQQRQQQGHLGEPDVMPSDLTALPGVDLGRYAAQFGQAEPESPSYRQAAGAAGPAGGAGGAPRCIASGARSPLPRRGGGVTFAPEPAPAHGQPPGAYEREASWHKSRSLAALHAIFEHAESEGSEQEEEGDGGSGSGDGGGIR